MGCTTSRIDETELVLRCKNRNRLMKQAVGYRQEFAIAHIAYIQSLKSFGIALRQFAEGDHDDVHPFPESPATPILSLTATLSPVAPILSPPSSPSPPPSQPPPASAATVSVVPAASNPPSSPKATSPQPVSHSSPATAVQSPSELSPPGDEMSRSISIAGLHSENGLVSSERSPMGSPVHSPGREEREEPEEFFLSPHSTSLNPPPPPSPPRDSSWDIFGFFHPPSLPFHLQEQRKMNQIEEEEEEDLEHVREQEGIPDLEDEELKNDGKEGKRDEEQDQEKPFEKISEEAVEVDLEKKGEDFDNEKLSEVVEDPIEEETLVVLGEETALEDEKEENEEDKKDLAVLTTLREKNIMDVARHVDDQFIRAYASGRDVAGMLETTKVHHHKAFLELKDSARVFNAITWHWSNKTLLALKNAGEDSDVAECGMTGSHSSTLERLYAWERKLYDEVKAGEIIRMAFDRKCEQLKSQDAKGEDPNVIDKTRAAVKNLDTQLIVCLRAIH